MYHLLSRPWLRWLAISMFAFTALAAAAGARTEASSTSDADRPLSVVATTTIVGDLVRQVGGDRIELHVLIAPGGDPHTYQATPRDGRVLAGADAVFANGAGLEDRFLEDLVANVDARLVVDLAEGTPLRVLGDDDEDNHHDDDEDNHHEHGGVDPHVWLDPVIVASWPARIAETLGSLDGTSAGFYRARAREISAEIDEMHQWAQRELASIPREARVLVTDHDSFGYFADRYGFSVVGTVIPGVSTVEEPSARELVALRQVILQHGVPALFVGVGLSGGAVAQSTAEDLGIELVSLYSGSLSEAEGPASSYLELIRYNVQAIADALGSG